MEWYRDEDHIGHDITGKKIKKKEREDKLQSFLASVDDSKNWSVFIFNFYIYMVCWQPLKGNKSINFFPLKFIGRILSEV